MRSTKWARIYLLKTSLCITGNISTLPALEPALFTQAINLVLTSVKCEAALSLTVYVVKFQYIYGFYKFFITPWLYIRFIRFDRFFFINSIYQPGHNLLHSLGFLPGALARTSRR